MNSRRGVEAVTSSTRCRRGHEQQDRERCREWGKTMSEANIVSDARGIRADLVIVAITPLREALPANPGLAMPERTPDMIDIAPAALAYHRRASTMERCSSSRVAR